MKRNWFDKLHVTYRVLIVLAFIIAAILGVLSTSSFVSADESTIRTWVPMPWPADGIPHPHPPEEPPEPTGGVY